MGSSCQTWYLLSVLYRQTARDQSAQSAAQTQLLSPTLPCCDLGATLHPLLQPVKFVFLLPVHSDWKLLKKIYIKSAGN